MTVQECYEKINGDYNDAIDRLGSDKLISKYLLKFLDLTDFDDMINYIEKQDWDSGFRSSHNLKGIAMNLSFTTLADSGSALCEAMRHGKPENDITPLTEKVKKDYAAIMEVLKEFKAEV